MNLAAVYDLDTTSAKEPAMPKAPPVLDVGVLRDAASMVETDGAILYDAVLAQPSPDSPTWATICDMGRFEAIGADPVGTLAALGNSKVIEQVLDQTGRTSKTCSGVCSSPTRQRCSNRSWGMSSSELPPCTGQHSKR